MYLKIFLRMLCEVIENKKVKLMYFNIKFGVVNMLFIFIIILFGLLVVMDSCWFY